MSNKNLGIAQASFQETQPSLNTRQNTFLHKNRPETATSCFAIRKKLNRKLILEKGQSEGYKETAQTLKAFSTLTDKQSNKGSNLQRRNVMK